MWPFTADMSVRRSEDTALAKRINEHRLGGLDPSGRTGSGGDHSLDAFDRYDKCYV